MSVFESLSAYLHVCIFHIFYNLLYSIPCLSLATKTLTSSHLLILTSTHNGHIHMIWSNILMNIFMQVFGACKPYNYTTEYLCTYSLSGQPSCSFIHCDTGVHYQNSSEAHIMELSLLGGSHCAFMQLCHGHNTSENVPSSSFCSHTRFHNVHNLLYHSCNSCELHPSPRQSRIRSEGRQRPHVNITRNMCIAWPWNKMTIAELGLETKAKVCQNCEWSKVGQRKNTGWTSATYYQVWGTKFVPATIADT